MTNPEWIFSPERAISFVRRQAAILEAAEILELQPENAVLFGGAALALHGLDAHVLEYNLLLTHEDESKLEPKFQFDVDAIITDEKLLELSSVHEAELTQDAEGAKIQIDRGNGVPLTFAGFTGSIFGISLETAQSNNVTVRGLATLPVEVLTIMKLDSGRAKDYAGLIQAHIVGNHDSIALTASTVWQTAVAAAMVKLQERFRSRPDLIQVYPDWLIDMAMKGFEDPAFEGEAFEGAKSPIK